MARRRRNFTALCREPICPLLFIFLGKAGTLWKTSGGGVSDQHGTAFLGGPHEPRDGLIPYSTLNLLYLPPLDGEDSRSRMHDPLDTGTE